MSTTSPDTLGERWTLDTSQTARTPFGRLVKVEWRKMFDTRSGFWLLLVTGLLLALTVGIVLLVIALEDATSGPSANDWSQIITIPFSILLPIFAITTVTSEWTQRTGLVTFSLEPHRLRLILAKLSAVVLLLLATMALAIALGAVGNVVGASIGGYDVEWNITAGSLALTLLVQVLYFLMAFGLGLAILNTPGAVAIFYVAALLLPLMVYSTLFFLFDWAQDVIPWIDLQYATAPLFENPVDLAGVDIARIVVAVVLWIGIPFAIGFKRVLSSEPK